MENIKDKNISELIDKVKNHSLNISIDSRNVQDNSLFISLPVLSPCENPLAKQVVFLHQAAQVEGCLLLCEKEIAQMFLAEYPEYAHKIYICPDMYPDSRTALGELASLAYDTCSNTFPLVGITGTNGKTTLSYLIEYFLLAQKKKVGVLGTVSYRYKGIDNNQEKDYFLEAPLTTPNCLFLHSFFHDMQQAHCDYAIMEVSSHSIEQKRIAGLNFDVAIFTNLTQDHLDYHKNMDSYFQVKAKLFDLAKTKIINADDPYGRKLLEKHTDALAYTLHDTKVDNKRLSACILNSSPRGLELQINYEDQEYILKTPLIGQHNAANILALIGFGLSYGYKLADFSCLANFNGVSGRLERVDNSENIHAFVDYAHTPDALVNVLQALRSAGFERIITVFGCGGDRDKTKRPLMATAVSSGSDVSVLTSDNPRTENPENILDDVEAGLDKSKEFYRLADRKEAILFAYNLIKKEENHSKTALLIAGKGHETYQIIGKTKYPFSDQEIIKEL